MWDLSHKVIQLIRVGRVQTVMRMPVMAGDSLSGKISAFVRMKNHEGLPECQTEPTDVGYSSAQTQKSC